MPFRQRRMLYPLSIFHLSDIPLTAAVHDKSGSERNCIKHLLLVLNFILNRTARISLNRLHFLLSRAAKCHAQLLCQYFHEKISAMRYIYYLKYA
ncbi:hypothetical protein T08_8995 [Trichinella sp. T8]|nr:hypothetical protein T08_8995 [Trichinella sp. T8]